MFQQSSGLSQDSSNFEDLVLPERRSGRLASLGMLAFPLVVAGGCRTVEMSTFPREPEPLTAELSDLFAIPEYELVELKEPKIEDGVAHYKGKLRVEEKELEFEYYVPQSPEGPKAFMVSLPIMAGGDTLTEMVCERLTARGMACGSIERRGKLFKQNESVEQLRYDFVDTVRHNRAFLDWISQRPEIDGRNLGCIGISMGAHVGNMLAAVEPRLDASILCLGGGDLADMMMNTTIGRVQDWALARCEENALTLREFQQKLNREFDIDPARLARHVDPNKVLLVGGDFDFIVPKQNLDLLWEMQGRPMRIHLPTEHLTAILALNWLMDKTQVFANERFES